LEETETSAPKSISFLDYAFGSWPLNVLNVLSGKELPTLESRTFSYSHLDSTSLQSIFLAPYLQSAHNVTLSHIWNIIRVYGPVMAFS